jgi:hypothetical protein
MNSEYPYLFRLETKGTLCTDTYAMVLNLQYISFWLRSFSTYIAVNIKLQLKISIHISVPITHHLLYCLLPLVSLQVAFTLQSYYKYGITIWKHEILKRKAGLVKDREQGEVVCSNKVVWIWNCCIQCNAGIPIPGCPWEFIIKTRQRQGSPRLGV